MQYNQTLDRAALIAASDETLGNIFDDGFFTTPGSLTIARAACAELIFARDMIEAQTVEIAALRAALQKELGAKGRPQTAEIHTLRID